jgi:hypothetical protein
VAVGPCRHSLRRLEATFANFWIRYIFSENREKINIKNKKIPSLSRGLWVTGPQGRLPHAACSLRVLMQAGPSTFDYRPMRDRVIHKVASTVFARGRAMSSCEENN